MTPKRIAVLDILRVVGMLFVMFIHSPVEGDAKFTPAIFLLKGFFASGAVPVFFILSGYLGAKKIKSADFQLFAFAKNKLNIWIIPFLFWNILVLTLVFVVKASGLATDLRGNGAYFDVEFTPSSIASAILGIGRPPIVYQFWFLRDLIVVAFVALIVCRMLPPLPLVAWFFFFIPLPMASSLGYYLLGHKLHSFLPPEKFPTVRSSLLYCLCWLAMGIGALAGFTSIPFPIQQLGSACFVLTLGIIFSATPWSHKIALLGPATFFIYATHEPLQTIVAKAWQTCNIPLYGSLFCFLLIPAAVFSICVYTYFIFSKICPQLMVIATGSRELPNKAVDLTVTRVTSPASSVRSEQEPHPRQP